jgi:hypothetical protein
MNWAPHFCIEGLKFVDLSSHHKLPAHSTHRGRPALRKMRNLSPTGLSITDLFSAGPSFAGNLAIDPEIGSVYVAQQRDVEDGIEVDIIRISPSSASTGTSKVGLSHLD